MIEKRKKGERYNPFRVFTGMFIPEAIARIPVNKLSFGAKICFGRLCRYAGRDGIAFPKRETLAKEIGSSARTIDRYIAELKEFGLIEVERKGLQKSNRYYFVWHSVFDKAGKKESISENESSQDLPDVATQTLPNSATPIESISEENESVINGSIYHSGTCSAENDDSDTAFLGRRINGIIRMFKPFNDVGVSRLFKNKTQRDAVERLLKKVGEEELKEKLKFLTEMERLRLLANKDKYYQAPYSEIMTLNYVPEIKTPRQMEEKFCSLRDRMDAVVNEMESQGYFSFEEMIRSCEEQEDESNEENL